MANTYVKIASVTVGSGGAATIDFNSISATYTDLLVKISARTTTNGVNNLYWKINGTSTGYSDRWVRGNGANAASATGTTTYFSVPIIDANDDTASTFGNAEIYLPNYAGSTNKSVSIDSVNENNATTAYTHLTAGLWSNTAAITSLSFYAASGNLAQYSTATLYGILKN
jgi:hypothetical protein